MINNDEKILEIKEAIIKAIAFFDMFDYPLTANEIFNSLSVKCELIAVMDVLDSKVGAIERYDGFYFLSGRGAIVRERLSRYNFTDRKFKRAMLVSKIFKFIPWVKMIAVGNLLGAHNLKDDSDIDFFIVAEDKRIWLTRFFCAGIAKLLGLRPQTGNYRDKICLSFYVSEKAMDLSGLMLGEANPDSPRTLRGGNGKKETDVYFIYWLAGLAPLYDVGGVYEELIEANQWLYANLPNWQPINLAGQRQVKPLLSEFYHDIINLFIGGLEPQLKALQLRLLPPQSKNLMNRDNRVVVNDQIIKLHANDRREEYRKKYQEKNK